MRLRIKFASEKNKLRLPIHYNEIIQGFIYKHISPQLAEKLHDQGFEDPETGKKFKFFTFSRLIPETKPVFQKDFIIFKSPINLIISSINKDFIQSLVENLLANPSLYLQNQKITLLSVEILPLPSYREKIFIKTLSPITVYTTFHTKEGKKKTYYYNPKEKEFSQNLLENLKNKVKVWYGKEINNGKIKLVKLTSQKERVVIYKNIVIKGWDGIFELNLPEEMFKMAFLTGLGAKNSAGFGCIEISTRKK